MGSFWDSEANKFTIYGALFGFLFPVIATVLEALLNVGELSWYAISTVQRTDPLLWIIDSAPFWLGIFARFAGKRQDYLKRLLRESGRTPNLLPQQTEDASQFAGTLTIFGLALIAVVLLGLGMWIQSLIVTRLPLGVTTEENTIPVTVNNSPETNTTAVPNPITIIEAGPATAPARLLLVTATPTTAAIVLVVQGSTAMTTPATPAIFSQIANTTTANADEIPTVLQATATPTVDPTMHRVRLGYLEGNQDCLFFSQLAALVWPQRAGVEVELQAFTDSDALFAALATEQPQRIDLTFCFLDPDNRTYLRQYVGIIEVLGKAFWKGESYSLLTVANARSATLIRKNQACLYELIRKQTYTELTVTTLDPASWAAENTEKLGTWLSCSNM